MKKIIFLVLVFAVVFSGVVFGEGNSVDDKPAFLTNGYFTLDIGSGIDSKHKIVDSFMGQHFIVLSLVLADGEHHLYIDLKDSDGNLFYKADLGKTTLENPVTQTLYYHFNDTPPDSLFVYDLYDMYNGEKYFINRFVVVASGI